MRSLAKAFALVIAHLAVVGAPATGQDRPKPSAYVGNKDALFLFEAPEKQLWHWFHPDTEKGVLEFGWSIEVGNTTRHRLAYALYKPGAAVADSGSLSELLRYGQRTLWLSDTLSGGFRAGPPVDLKLSAMSGQILLHLDDEDVVAMLFGTRPAEVKYETVINGAVWSAGSMEVHYTGSDEKVWTGSDDSDRSLIAAIAPGFDLPLLQTLATDGEVSRVRSSDLVGRPAVLYFWSSHCPVSRAEFDGVMRHARDWSERGVHIIGVTTRQDARADRAFLAQRSGSGIRHAVATAEMEELYNVQGTPYVVLIDAAGRIVYRAFSAGQWSAGGVLARKLSRLLEPANGDSGHGDSTAAPTERRNPSTPTTLPRFP